MVNLVLILVLALAVGGAAAYLIRAKKRGVRCVGCPSGRNRPGCGGRCGCKPE